MYQGVPSTPLLRQLSYIMPYVYFNIYFTPLEAVRKVPEPFWSSQLLIDDLIACDSRWSIKQGYNISLLSLEQALFHGWLSIQTGLSEVLFPYNDKGQDNTNLVP